MSTLASFTASFVAWRAKEEREMDTRLGMIGRNGRNLALRAGGFEQRNGLGRAKNPDGRIGERGAGIAARRRRSRLLLAAILAPIPWLSTSAFGGTLTWD